MDREKSYERIKNYTTTIAVEKTIGEIERMLAKFGATRVMKEFDENGTPNKVTFGVLTNHGEMPIKLPVNIKGIMDVFKLQVSRKKLPNKYWGSEWSKQQAYRVGWRIIKDWLDSQLTLLQIQMVKVEEIFLPYIYNPKLDKTMFQMLEERNFNLMLEDNSNSQMNNLDSQKKRTSDL